MFTDPIFCEGFGKNANNFVFVACRNERVLYWRSTDCKIYSFNFFCQQILPGLKNNVLNNWRVMVKIRPSTEEIEMHDLYSTDYRRMISRFLYMPKIITQTKINIPLIPMSKILIFFRENDWLMQDHGLERQFNWRNRNAWLIQHGLRTHDI